MLLTPTKFTAVAVVTARPAKPSPLLYGGRSRGSNELKRRTRILRQLPQCPYIFVQSRS